MTDRFNYITVALEHDIRADDAEQVLKAIVMLKGVINVEPNIVTPDDWMAESRAKHELRHKLLEALK